MSLFLVDISTDALKKAEEALKEVQGVGEVHSMVVDVSKVKEVVAFRDKVLDIFGEVSVQPMDLLLIGCAVPFDGILAAR